MNWTWRLRSRDGGMNGLEFSECLTAGEQRQVLVHAAPAKLSVEVRDDAGVTVASGDVDREGDYAPMTLLRLDGATVRRSEVWPDADDEGTVVLLAGGEAGVLRSWRHSDDRQWWQWSLELSNHKDRPADWHPPAT